MPCPKCPCPDVCLARPIWCEEWAPRVPSNPIELRAICDRSRIARGEVPSRSYPSAAQQAANVARSLWDWGVSGFSAATEEEQARRLAICEACPARNAADRRCWRCGCFTDLKVRLRTEHCPESKW